MSIFFLLIAKSYIYFEMNIWFGIFAGLEVFSGPVFDGLQVQYAVNDG